MNQLVASLPPRIGVPRQSVASVRPPSLRRLGLDLLTSTASHRAIAVVRPVIWFAVYVFTARSNLILLLPFAMFMLFVSLVTITHDLVHGSLGFGRRTTEIALALTGAVLLESGHAYRYTHLHHHRTFPDEHDPEGSPARATLFEALVSGPLFLSKLWWFAWSERSGNRHERAWLLAEALTAILVPVFAFMTWSTGLLTYCALAILASWTYPLLAVHLPHRASGPGPLEHTRTVRGRIIPKLLLELTYHLEHHLYPQVPSHHLAELARRLDPWLAANGVRPVRLP